MRNQIHKFLVNMFFVSLLLSFAACGSVSEIEVSSHVNSDKDNISSSKSEQFESVAVSSNTQNIFASEGDLSQEDDSGIIVALPSDELHTEPNQWYDRLVADINEYTGMNITWKWYSKNTYYQQMEADMLSGEIADVVISDKSEAFLAAAEAGLFWDLGPYIDEYDNLAAIHEIRLMGASYNGKVYGLPRSGQLFSDGLIYRKDWLEKLGLKEPTDWESFCEMLYAFTYKDPDGDGVDDTVGLVLDSSPERWDAMELWFGVPNEWGIDENGDLIHETRTQEYREAYAEFRRLYAQGVINSGTNGIVDFRELESDKALESCQKSIAGSIVHYPGYAEELQNYFVERELITEDNIIFMPQAYVDTGRGIYCHTHSVSGMHGMVAISTKRIKSEEQLREVLQCLNDLNDGECINLVRYGWEDETYCITEDGYIDVLATTERKKAYYDRGFSEILTYITAEENKSPLGPKIQSETPTSLLAAQMVEEYKKYCVPNYGAQYYSDTYESKGVELDAMLFTAEQQYIIGEIDDAGFEAVLTAWWEAGGEAITREINEKYHTAGF